MKPRSAPFVKQVEDAAEEIHQHIRRATGLACDGDLRRAHAEAERAQGAARRLKELLGAAAAQPDITRDAMGITCALSPDGEPGKLSPVNKRESGT